MAAVLVDLMALVDLVARQEVVAVGLRRKMALPLDDEVVAGNPVVMKVVVGMVALSENQRPVMSAIIGIQGTLLRIWGIISLRILLRRGSLRWVTSAISLIVTAILICRLSLCH